MINQLAFFVKHNLWRLGISYEEGQGLVEYALIILFVALVVIGALRFLGVQLNETFEYIRNEIPEP